MIAELLASIITEAISARNAENLRRLHRDHRSLWIGAARAQLELILDRAAAAGWVALELRTSPVSDDYLLIGTHRCGHRAERLVSALDLESEAAPVCAVGAMALAMRCERCG